jgi:TRAP-type transport system periplasmic protein
MDFRLLIFAAFKNIAQVIIRRRFMLSKKSYLLCISLVLIVAFMGILVLAGCSSTASATTTNAPAQTTSAPPPTTTFEMKFLDQYATGTAAANQTELLGKLISDGTNGRLKINYYHAESLGKIADFVTLLNGGVTDIVTLTPGAYPTQFDVESYVNLPMAGINSRAAGIEVLWALYDKGYLTGLKDYKVLAFNPTAPMNIWLKKKSDTVDGLKGLKIRGGDAPARSFIDSIGAVGTSLASGEVYMSLDRGTIDGTITTDEQVFNTKLYEVVKYGIYNPKTTIGVTFMLMNKNTWNNLPKDIQAAIDKGIAANKTAFLDSVKEADANYAAQLTAKGMELYTLNATEASKLASLSAPLRDNWVTQRQAKGVPAQDIANLVNTILAKYK